MIAQLKLDQRKRDDEVIDNIIREIFGPDVNLEYIDKDAVSYPWCHACFLIFLL